MTEKPGDSSVDAVIAAVIYEAAGTEIPASASFFDAGLTSETLIEVHVGLQRRLGRIFPVATLFKYPSRRALSRYFTHPTEAAVPMASPDTMVTAWTPQDRKELRARIRGRKR
ncbi:acyl carrier protein [Kibdelosporangium aridum]|uniref:acyl carrier protein n=1 Tax=Kibdelosporangium aridum TaxID=2030 RepID=UPI0005253CDF